KECQKAAWKTHKHECLVISTFAHDEADASSIPTTTRDTDSFPRSSYTFATTIPKTSAWRSDAVAAFLAVNGPLVIFTAWLQDPQPPAIQSVPFEKRLIYGLLDSLLQIECVRC
ncbi:hypothetical protein DYB31_007153, partial [Aphanomyces astaci]